MQPVELQHRELKVRASRMRAALGTTAVVVFLAVALSQLGPQLMPSESGAGTPVAETPPVDTLPTATSWPRGKMESPEYGMQAFLWWDRHAAERDLELIRDAGFGWVKQNAPWREVEGAAKGAFNWYFTDRIVDSAESYGLDILLRLDSEPLWAVRSDSVGTANGPPENPQDFGDFCRAMAERYRGRVRAYQVWNEPNLSREWGGWEPSPSEYVELLRACYIGIKNGDPDAWVISAGLAPTGTTLPEAIPDDEFLTGMYEAGAAPFFDILGLHAPGFAYPPEASLEEVAGKHNGHRFFCFRHVEDMREIMLEYGDASKQVAILEMGWTSDQIHPEYAWFAVSEATKADYLVRAFDYARQHWTPWIGLMTVISIADGHWDEEDEQYWWAITEPGWPGTTVRPAYEALRDMDK
jgi:hypothetical protein